MTRAAILGIDIEYIDGTRKTFDRNEVNMAFGYPKLTRGYTPPAGLISAFSASSSMGVRFSTPHSASLKMPKSNLLEAEESDSGRFPALQGA